MERRLAFLFSVVALAPAVLGLALPVGVSAKQLDCVHPEIEATTTPPAVVGIPYSASSETYWCLEAADELSDPMINWGDGTVSPGTVAYGPEMTSVVVGHSPEQVRLKTGSFTGSHVYTGPEREAQITFSATELPEGNALSSSKGVLVLPRDVVHAAGPHAPGGVTNGIVAEVSIPPLYPFMHELEARIYWGDGRRGRGTVERRSPEGGKRPVRYAVFGYHHWRHPGAYTVRVVVSDRLGPQEYVTRDHVVVPGRAA